MKLPFGLGTAVAFLSVMIVLPSLLGSVATAVALIVGLILTGQWILGRADASERSFECNVASVVCFAYFAYLMGATLIAGGAPQRLLEAALILPAVLFPAIFRCADLQTSALRPQLVSRVAAVGLVPVLLALGVSTYAFGSDRTGLLAGNPNILGGVMSVQIVLSFAGWGDAGRAERLAIAAIALVSTCAAYLFTGNDGAILALIVAACLASLPLTKLLWSKGRKGWNFGFGVALVTAAFVALMVVFLLLPLTIRFPTAEYWPSSTMQRLIMYQTGIQSLFDHPVFGVGLHQRFYATVAYYPTPPPDDFWFSHLHNSFLTHAVAGGVPGAALSVAIMLLPSFILRTTQLARFGNMLSGVLVGVGLTEVLLLNDLKMTVALMAIAWSLGIKRTCGVDTSDRP